MTERLPLRFDGHGINDRNGNRICKVDCCEPYLYDTGRPVRNVEFDQLSETIVRAVNSHYELIEALTQTLDALYNETHGQDDTHWITTVKAAARAALAKAKGEAT